MCGIAGFFSKRLDADSSAALEIALDTMEKRGPDDRGVHVEGNRAIGMQRLSIVDHDKGAQPQYNSTKDVAVVHNGEIYNFTQLKEELSQAGCRFANKSDTEVLVHGYEAWGIEKLLEKIEGMFAFAVLDKASGKLHLARDRFGEKPLYLHSSSESFSFASDLKSLVRALALTPEIDPLSLRRYLALHHITGNRSIVKGVERLLPGQRIVVSLNNLSARKHTYYELSEGPKGRMDEAKLASLLEEAVTSRLMGDVPVGVFLSGGLDSSIVSAIASRSAPNVKAFSIGFDSHAHDESKFAAAVAESCGLSHQLIPFAEEDFRELLPVVSAQLDEPLGDPAALPTSKMCRVAKESVKVALSGEGADELFAGYNYYAPHAAKNVWLKRLFGGRPPSASSALLDPHSLTTPSGFPLVSGKAEWESLSLLAPSEESDAWETEFLARVNAASDPLLKATLADILTWLPDNLLVKFDRMTMLHSLEGRSPFLMKSLVEYAVSLPSGEKIRGKEVKRALRKVAKKWLPSDILTRRKQGFVLPMGNWILRYVNGFGGVSEYVRARACGCLDDELLARTLEERLKQPAGNERILYSLVHFLEWHHHFNAGL